MIRLSICVDFIVTPHYTRTRVLKSIQKIYKNKWSKWAILFWPKGAKLSGFSKRRLLLKQIGEIVKERLKYPAGDEMDADMKRLKYVRYADDFLIGVIGSKEDCIKIKEDIKQFMADKLKLELSDEKTLITNARKHAKFLGYDVFVRKSNDTRRDKNGHLTRSLDYKIVLYVTTEVMRKKLLEYDAVKITVQKGKEVWNPKGRNICAVLMIWKL